jgi:hypothetical protein
VEKPKDNNSKTRADAHPERHSEIFLLFLKNPCARFWRGGESVGVGAIFAAAIPLGAACGMPRCATFLDSDASAARISVIIR